MVLHGISKIVDADNFWKGGEIMTEQLLEARNLAINETPDKRIEKLNEMDAETRELCEATGTSAEECAHQLFEQLVVAMPKGMDCGPAMSAHYNFLKDLALKDPLEGILAVQMLSIQGHFVEQLAKAKHAKSPELENLHQKNAVALSNLFGKQMDRLNNYRKKGNQTIQVQHVNISAGGQAIVGNVQNTREGLQNGD